MFTNNNKILKNWGIKSVQKVLKQNESQKFLKQNESQKFVIDT